MNGLEPSGDEAAVRVRQKKEVLAYLDKRIGTFRFFQERCDEEDFHEEDLGPVRFVPLIGAHGWSESEA